MRVIHTKRGDAIKVDDDTFESLSETSWCLDSKGYATRGYWLAPGKWTTTTMHRELMGLKPGDGRYVDHINGDKLDNRRENLRICSNAENGANRGPQKNSSTGYKGVTRVKRSGKYLAQITAYGKHRYLGTFESAELASEFYGLAACLLFGDFARTAKEQQQ